MKNLAYSIRILIIGIIVWGASCSKKEFNKPNISVNSVSYNASTGRLEVRFAIASVGSVIKNFKILQNGSLYKTETFDTRSKISNFTTNYYSNNGSYLFTSSDTAQTNKPMTILCEATNYAGETDQYSYYWTPATINITSPTKDNSYQTLSRMQISWKSSFVIQSNNSYYQKDKVIIDLYNNNGLVCKIYDPTQYNSSYSTSENSLSWPIPSSIQSGNYYIVMSYIGQSNKIVGKSGVFKIDNQVSITSPVASSIWSLGTTQTISWSSGLGYAVSIDLYKSGVYLQHIASPSVSNQYSYNWTLSTSLTTGNDYSIRVSNLSDYNANCVSSIFKIDSQATIISPDAKSNWSPETTQTISWSSGLGYAVSIDLYKGGVYLQHIASPSVSNQYSYNWMLSTSLTTGSDYSIRVSKLNDNNTYCISSMFSITNSNQKKMQIYSPIGSVTWIRTGTYSISWGGASSEYVDIVLYRNNNPIETIVSNYDGGGKAYYSWTNNFYIEPGSGYTIRVINHNNPDEYAISGAITFTAK